MSSMNETFSDDVIINILSWLPLKEAARMQAVCKRWRALTSEHHFLLCTSFSRNTSHSIDGFFLSDTHYRKFSYVGLPKAIRNNHQLIPDLSFIPSTPAIDKGQIYVTSSCSGLLVCSRPIISIGYKSTWYVCNPMTRKFIEIDVPEGITHYLFLAYDPTKCRHYKIFAFGLYDIHMYSSQTRSWRVAHHSDESDYSFRGLHCYHNVFWSGSLVFVVQRRLVRFMIDEEQVVKMPMPRRPEGWMCAYVGESGGHLQMIGFTEGERLAGFLDVLEMQEGSPEWSLLYRVDLTRVKELYPEVKKIRAREFPSVGLRRHSAGTSRTIEYLALWPLYVVRGIGANGRHGMMLFSIPGKIMCYNTEDQAISIIDEVITGARPDSYQYYWYHFSPYNPSLFVL